MMQLQHTHAHAIVLIPLDTSQPAPPLAHVTAGLMQPCPLPILRLSSLLPFAESVKIPHKREAQIDIEVYAS